jgi:hypothetical protein
MHKLVFMNDDDDEDDAAAAWRSPLEMNLKQL